MSTGSHTHHAIDYLEFTVSDMQAAQKFYHDAFGWKFTAYGPDYAGIKWGDTEIGGLRSDIPVKPGGVLVVLFSNDLPATLEAVKAAGGTITAAPFDFPGGRRFHFTDPAAMSWACGRSSALACNEK